jgi:hypothetical protein
VRCPEFKFLHARRSLQHLVHPNTLESGSDAALHRELEFRLVEKDGSKFFLFVRSMIEAIASGWRAGAFVLVLTLSAFRKIVGEQRQKK